MHFVRTYKGGGANYDPRQKHYAVYHCEVCGSDEDVDITGRAHQVQFDKPRRCPKCKMIDKNDRIFSVRKEIERLTATQDDISVQIEQLTTELSELTTSEEGQI